MLRFAIALMLLLQQPQQKPQTTPPPQPDPQQTPKVEEAHRGLLQLKSNTGKEIARYTDKLASSIPGAGDPFAKIARKNLIDEQIFGRLERDRIPHAPISSDSEFVRRAYVDATGQLPSLETVRAFLANSDPLKRDK